MGQVVPKPVSYARSNDMGGTGQLNMTFADSGGGGGKFRASIGDASGNSCFITNGYFLMDGNQVNLPWTTEFVSGETSYMFGINCDVAKCFILKGASTSFLEAYNSSDALVAAIYDDGSAQFGRNATAELWVGIKTAGQASLEIVNGSLFSFYATETSPRVQTSVNGWTTYSLDGTAAAAVNGVLVGITATGVGMLQASDGAALQTAMQWNADSVIMPGFVEVQSSSEPSGPSAGNVRFWSQSNRLYMLEPSGTAREVLGGGANAMGGTGQVNFTYAASGGGFFRTSIGDSTGNSAIQTNGYILMDGTQVTLPWTTQFVTGITSYMLGINVDVARGIVMKGATTSFFEAYNASEQMVAQIADDGAAQFGIKAGGQSTLDITNGSTFHYFATEANPRVQTSVNGWTTYSASGAVDATLNGVLIGIASTGVGMLQASDGAALETALQWDSNDGASQAGILIRHNGAIKRVNVGGTDSGGSGQRLLTVDN